MRRDDMPETAVQYALRARLFYKLSKQATKKEKKDQVYRAVARNYARKALTEIQTQRGF